MSFCLEPEPVDVDFKQELKRLRRAGADVDRAGRREQRDGAHSLRRQARDQLRHVDPGQVDRAAIDHRVSRVIEGGEVEVQLVGGLTLGRLGDHGLDVEHQDRLRAVVEGVELRPVAAQHQVVGKAERDRRCGRQQHRVGERVFDDADLGPSLVQVLVVARKLRIFVIDPRQVVIGHERIGRVCQDRHAGCVTDVQVDRLWRAAVERRPTQGHVTELRPIRQPQPNILRDDRIAVQH